MALAAGTFFGTAADGGSKVTTGFFPTQKEFIPRFLFGEDPCLKSMEADFILVLLTQWSNCIFQVCMKKRNMMV